MGNFRYLGGSDFTGRVFCSTLEIDRHLDADRPIIVGVNHTPNRNINEGATDHWIVIARRG